MVAAACFRGALSLPPLTRPATPPFRPLVLQEGLRPASSRSAGSFRVASLRVQPPFPPSSAGYGVTPLPLPWITSGYQANGGACRIRSFL